MTHEMTQTMIPSLFATIVDHMNGIFLKDIHSKYVYVSSRFVPLLGYKNHDQIVGMTDYDIKCEAADFAQQFIEEDQRVIQNNQAASFIYVMKYADGNMYYMLGHKKRFYDPHTHFVGMLGQLIVITDTALIRSMNYFLRTEKHHLNHQQHLMGTYQLGNITKENISLTEMQGHCLFYLLRGKTSKEIGLLLHRSPRTIEIHIEQLKIKFNCPNKSLLIAKAIELGYLYHLPSTIFNLSPMNN